MKQSCHKTGIVPLISGKFNPPHLVQTNGKEIINLYCNPILKGE